MRMFKKTLLASAVAGSLMASSAMAGVSMNAAATSNYIWRGVTQTSDNAAVQGGIDYAHDSGFYAGTWASTQDSGYELDLYLGFGGEFASDWSYDVGYIYYAYPVNVDSETKSELDFGEIYGALGFKGFTLFGAKQVNQEADSDYKNKAYYISGDYTFEYADSMSTTLLVGYYGGDLIKEEVFGKNYTHFYADVSKSTDYGDVTLALEKNNIDNGSNLDDPRVVISWSKDF